MLRHSEWNESNKTGAANRSSVIISKICDNDRQEDIFHEIVETILLHN